MKSRVFVIHQPAVYNRNSGRMCPKYDLSPALKFGQIVEVLPPGSITQDHKLLRRQIKERLKEEKASAADYIIALGDPVAIITGALVINEICGEVNLLKWDRKLGEYFCCSL
jgi:hypothetical protein